MKEFDRARHRVWYHPSLFACSRRLPFKWPIIWNNRKEKTSRVCLGVCVFRCRFSFPPWNLFHFSFDFSITFFFVGFFLVLISKRSAFMKRLPLSFICYRILLLALAATRLKSNDDRLNLDAILLLSTPLWKINAPLSLSLYANVDEEKMNKMKNRSTQSGCFPKKKKNENNEKRFINVGKQKRPQSNSLTVRLDGDISVWFFNRQSLSWPSVSFYVVLNVDIEALDVLCIIKDRLIQRYCWDVYLIDIHPNSSTRIQRY